jgi:hypothetical protein
LYKDFLLMLFKRILLSCIFTIVLVNCSWAQDTDEDTEKEPILTYESVVDNPYEINKLWIHLQPLYAELFVTNVNLGFGVQVDYQIASKLGLTAQWRRAYAQPTDFAREVANKNQDNLDNNKTFNYWQLGGVIHVSDKVEQGKTKIILYSRRYQGKRWANRIPETIEVPAQIRKIYGLRWGGIMYNTTTDISRAAVEQGINLVDAMGSSVGDAKLYGNIESTAVYLGASYSVVKNIGIKPHRDFGVLVNDLHITGFVDLIYAPSLEVEDIILGNTMVPGSQLSLSDFGFRAGIEGKFNKTFGYSYGAEIGYRPSLEQRTFYAMFRISFPVIGILPRDLSRPYRN